MTLNSSAVSAGDTVTSAERNNLREDVILNGGDATGTVGGTADAITLTIDSAYVAYANGDKIRFKATSDNTTTTTINVNSLGVKTIKNVDGQNLQPKAIRDGAWIEIQYDGTDFILTSASILHAAKGDIISASADGTPVALNVGSNGTALLADSGETTGIKWGGVSTTLDVDTSQVDYTNSTTETDLMSYTVPGGTLGTDNVLKVKLIFSRIYGNGSADLIIRVKYGSTTVEFYQFDNINEVSVTGVAVLELFFLGNGSTSSQILRGWWLNNYETTNTSKTDYGAYFEGTSSEDSTGDLDFDVTAEWSTTSTAAVCRKEFSIVELLAV